MARTDPPRVLEAATFQDADGTPRTLADYAGRGLVVNLWAAWCVPCVAEMPELQELARAVADDGILVLPLSGDRGGAEVVRRLATPPMRITGPPGAARPARQCRPCLGRARPAHHPGDRPAGAGTRPGGGGDGLEQPGDRCRIAAPRRIRRGRGASPSTPPGSAPAAIQSSCRQVPIRSRRHRQALPRIRAAALTETPAAPASPPAPPPPPPAARHAADVSARASADRSPIPRLSPRRRRAWLRARETRALVLHHQAHPARCACTDNSITSSWRVFRAASPSTRPSTCAAPAGPPKGSTPAPAPPANAAAPAPVPVPSPPPQQEHPSPGRAAPRAGRARRYPAWSGLATRPPVPRICAEGAASPIAWAVMFSACPAPPGGRFWPCRLCRCRAVRSRRGATGGSRSARRPAPCRASPGPGPGHGAVARPCG